MQPLRTVVSFSIRLQPDDSRCKLPVFNEPALFGLTKYLDPVFQRGDDSGQIYHHVRRPLRCSGLACRESFRVHPEASVGFCQEHGRHHISGGRTDLPCFGGHVVRLADYRCGHRLHASPELCDRYNSGRGCSALYDSGSPGEVLEICRSGLLLSLICLFLLQDMAGHPETPPELSVSFPGRPRPASSPGRETPKGEEA
jgi:hypothetical protein